MLSISFRPFFLLASLIAVINPLLWVLTYQGHFILPLYYSDSLFWHAHEMLFGFSSALIGGFILTASANWTSSKPYQGKYLLLLIILWLIERASYFLPLPSAASLVLLNLFFPVLWIMLLKKLWKFPKQKYVFMPLLLGFTLANFLHSWGYLYSVGDWELNGRDIGIGLVRFIVLLIGGRVIPFFTRKRIENISIEVPKWLNLMSLAPVLLLAFPWPESTPRVLLIALFVIAAVANITRQLTWKPLATLGVPILYILHIGIAFINIQLILEIIGFFFSDIHYTNAPLHLLSAGGLGIISVGIMSRVSLGHTGRAIKADVLIKLIYFFIAMGAISRVVTPLLFPDHYNTGILLAAIFWSGGFLLFFIKFAKMLCAPRPDGKSY